MMNRIEQITLSLVRTALSGESSALCPDENEWKEVFSFAVKHGIDALAFDGIQACYTSNPSAVVSLDVPSNKSLKYDWFGSGLNAEVTYSKHKCAIADLASLYQKGAIKMLLLKGYGLSLDYPIPEHRPMGDIDIFLYGLGKQADELVEMETGVKPKQNEDKHSTFSYESVSVENHASFINTTVHPKMERLEVILECEAANSSAIRMDNKDGEKVSVFLPPVNVNALFLPLHCAGHFVHGEASLRQLCDWACFVRKYGKEVNWDFVWQEAEAAGFDKFFCCLNGIVEQYLGVPVDALPAWPRYPELQERILTDIFEQGPPKKLSVFGKLHRFFSSQWRRKLVYRESMISTFFRQAKSYFRLHNSSAKSIWDK